MENTLGTSATSGIELAVNKKILRAMGLWGSSGVYRIFSWVMALSVVAHVSTEIVGIYKYSYELKFIAIITCIMLSGIGAACKAIYCIVNNRKFEVQMHDPETPMISIEFNNILVFVVIDAILLAVASRILLQLKIQELVMTLESSLFVFEHMAQKRQAEVVHKNMKVARGVTIIFETMCVAIVVLWMAAPLIFGDPSSPLPRPLPLLACFPFDSGTSPGYWIAYLFQTVTSFITTSIIGGVDTLCVSTLIHIGGQLEALALTLEELGAEFLQLQLNPEESMINRTSRKNLEIVPVGSSRSFDKSYQQLVTCIRHHQAIIEFATEVQSVFGPIMLFQCCSSTLILCFVGFVAAESSVDLGTLVKCVVYLVVGTFELWLYCVFADRVMERSQRIAEASYGSGWRMMPTRFKRTLMMVIMRAQRPISFRASFLYIMSLQTFASILNASYSYFTILQQAKE